MTKTFDELEAQKQEQLDKIEAAKKTIRNLESQMEFEKLQENERLDLETDGQWFYHGQLKYKSGELIDYYSIQNDFYYARYPIEGGYGYSWMKGWDWREFITHEHEYWRAKNNIIDLPEDLTNTIIYESQNARNFTPEKPRIKRIND